MRGQRLGEQAERLQQHAADTGRGEITRSGPPLLAEALNALSSFRVDKAILCVVFPLDPDVVRALLADERIAGLILRDPPAKLVAEFPDRIQRYSPPERILRAPGGPGMTLVLVGLHRLMFYGVAACCLRAGIFRALLPIGGRWRTRSTARLLAEQILRAKAGKGRLVMRIARRIGWRTLDRMSWRSCALKAVLHDMPRENRLHAAISNLAGENMNDPAGIVFFTGSLDAGGAERQMINTILGLNKRGVGPLRVICALSADGFYRRVLERTGIPVDLMNFAATDVDRLLADIDMHLAGVLDALPFETLCETVAMRDRLRRYRPQILHTWQDHCNVSGGVAAVLAGVERIVLSTRSLAPYHFGFFQLGQHPSYAALQAMPHVTMLNNSVAGASDYADWLRLPKTAIRVLHNGVDGESLTRPESDAVDAFRESLGIPRDAPVLGTVSSLYAIKRPLLWLAVARRVARKLPDAHFLIVGDGVLRRAVERRIAAHGLAGRVHLTGKAPDVALPFAVMDAFLLTSRFEGLPNVLLEAQMMGVPVVTAAVGGAPEAVNDGVTGIVVRHPTSRRLAAAVERVLREPEWRNRTATAGPAFVERRFSASRMIDETLAVYGMTDHA